MSAPKDKGPVPCHAPARRSFDVAVKTLVVDDSLNPRFAASVAARIDTPGEEQAGLKELAESMRSIGQLHNIGVDRCPRTNAWRVRFGFRRVKAALQEGIGTLRAIESTNPVDSLAENVGPKRLLAVEITLAVKALLENDPPMTHARIATYAGLARPSVTNYAQLAKHLHPRILEVWRQRPGIFKVQELLQVSHEPKELQVEWLQKVHGLKIEARLKPEEDAPDDEKPRGAVRSRSAGEKLRERIETGRLDKGEDWREGALSILSWWLDGTELK